jgi:hypothetical protein
LTFSICTQSISFAQARASPLALFSNTSEIHRCLLTYNALAQHSQNITPHSSLIIVCLPNPGSSRKLRPSDGNFICNMAARSKIPSLVHVTLSLCWGGSCVRWPHNSLAEHIIMNIHARSLCVCVRAPVFSRPLAGWETPSNVCIMSPRRQQIRPDPFNDYKKMWTQALAALSHAPT